MCDRYYHGRMQRSHGFTLTELLVTVVIVAIFAASVLPNMSGFFDGRQLAGAAEQVYAHLQQTRSESIARSAPMFVNFADTGDADWTYGVSGISLCDVTVTDPTTANACTIVVDDGDGLVDPGDGSVDTADLVLMRSIGDDHGEITMTINNFSSGNTQIRFDPMRGTSDSGEVLLVSAAGRQLMVKASLLGQIRVCSPDNSLTGYNNTDC